MGSCCCELSRFIPLYRLPFFLVVTSRRILLVGGAEPLFPLLFLVVLLGTGVRLLGAAGVAVVAVVVLPCLVRLLRFFSPFFGMFGVLGTLFQSVLGTYVMIFFLHTQTALLLRLTIFRILFALPGQLTVDRPSL